jgi:hypothetical protein
MTCRRGLSLRASSARAERAVSAETASVRGVAPVSLGFGCGTVVAIANLLDLHLDRVFPVNFPEAVLVDF